MELILVASVVGFIWTLAPKPEPKKGRLRLRHVNKFESQVRDLASQLQGWDLDWDFFPDIREEVSKMASRMPYGSEQACDYLHAVAEIRSRHYWRCQGNWRYYEDQEKYHRKRFMGVLADLRGDAA